jgi:hypothetical protein
MNISLANGAVAPTPTSIHCATCPKGASHVDSGTQVLHPCCSGTKINTVSSVMAALSNTTIKTWVHSGCYTTQKMSTRHTELSQYDTEKSASCQINYFIAIFVQYIFFTNVTIILYQNQLQSLKLYNECVDK